MASYGLDRVVTGMLDAMCRRMWGFPARMMPVAVDRMGPLPALRWFARNMPRFLRTRHVLGPLRTHLACVVISLHNSCTYCAYGHAYALELIYLRDRDRLFPLDAHTLSGWLGLEPQELSSRLRGLLQDAGLHREVLWLDTTLALAQGAAPVDHEEARLAHLVQMVGTMNRVATSSGVEPDEAHDPINKDADLKERLSALRAVVG
ncbi:MAG: hypothetical protein QOG20_3319 [Pseudonocardiales bacterium]|jgi:hypothetical protein|uniref:hypothetical protein n=1 Tax=Pseudonocardia sp. TaxID=60912 RepID=UPI00261AFC66|nr:hypothetical protein [Pseudonocardia sp.]MCW2718131.1 hypothetical protein [Pseudonocardia sp.]MDT7617868.1 hypothetical protein [Pseudonocardiales bacterium]MDT7707712.1 hypothetical protein [Pseudonocardiales bacterium]